MHIGLFGLFGCGNTGNDGSLEAMLQFLRRSRPDAALTCICPAPDVVEATYGVPAISSSQPLNGPPLPTDRFGFSERARAIVDTVRVARSFDVVIVPGTGFLDDFSDSPFGWPLQILRWSAACRLAGVKVLMASIGAGPIEHPLSRFFMKRAAGMAEARSYRDAGSRAFLKRIGLDTDRDPIYPDLAFRLPAPAADPAPRERLTVGVGVMRYLGWKKHDPNGPAIFDAYLDKIGSFVAWLMREGHAVRLVTGDAGDWPAVEKLLSWLEHEAPELDRSRIAAAPAASLHELMAQLVTTDVVVATRYHNVVSALRLGKPTLSLGYAPKNDLLLAEMGMGAFCQHVETFDLQRLKSDFGTVLDRQEEYRQAIASVLAGYQLRIAEQDRGLLKAIDSPLRTPLSAPASAQVPRA